MHDQKVSDHSGGRPNDEKITETGLQPTSTTNAGQSIEFQDGQHMQRNIKSRHAQMIAIGGVSSALASSLVRVRHLLPQVPAFCFLPTHS